MLPSDKRKLLAKSYFSTLCFLCLFFLPARAGNTETFTIGAELNFSEMLSQTRLGTDSIVPQEMPVIKKKRRKTPWIAATSSAILPGAGQVYNGHWYKAPVIYAGGAVLYYVIDMNLKERKIYDKEIAARDKSDTTSLNASLAFYTDERLLDIRNYYQNNFELSIIIAGVVYLLNIVDALVYAHLSTFSVSDNLSLRIEPYAQPAFDKRRSFPLDAGFKFTLTLK